VSIPEIAGRRNSKRPRAAAGKAASCRRTPKKNPRDRFDPALRDGITMPLGKAAIRQNPKRPRAAALQSGDPSPYSEKKPRAPLAARGDRKSPRGRSGRPHIWQFPGAIL